MAPLNPARPTSNQTLTPTETIPLLCSACSWNPTFSDLSHLLTHINSKGHLSAYQKLKIRSRTDPAAAAALHHFNAWYGRFNIEGLLADRLAAKDEKEASKRQTPSRLSICVKQGHKSQKLCKFSPLQQSSPTHYYAPGPSHLHPYPTIDQLDSPITQPFGFEYSNTNSRESSILYRDGSSLGGESNETLLQEDIHLRLKGPTWPGMDIFDSASAEMKRKRNQRKDNSVLQKMRHDSLSVEPLESVWTLGLELERRRSVYDSPTPPPGHDDMVSEREQTLKRKKAARSKSVHKATKNQKSSTKRKPAFQKPAISRGLELLGEASSPNLGDFFIPKYEEQQSPNIFSCVSHQNTRWSIASDMSGKTNEALSFPLDERLLPSLADICLIPPSEAICLERLEMSRRPLLTLPTNCSLQLSPGSPKMTSIPYYHPMAHFGLSDQNPLCMNEHQSNAYGAYHVPLQTSPGFNPERHLTMSGFQSMNGSRGLAYSQLAGAGSYHDLEEGDDFVF